MAIVAATVAIAALHWPNDGLWFQGDAPRHAANGLFALDLLRALPTDPIAFALSYYARYPIIVVGAYPPLFYLLEAAAFSLTTPSPHVSKTLVLAFSAVAAMYTMKYGRRWISPVAGWAGVCLALTPGFSLFSNTVLLNVPATALGLGALYHCRSWMDTSRVSQRNLFVGLTAAMLSTYYPAVVVVPVLVAWMWVGLRPNKLRALFLTIATAVLVVLIGLAVPTYLTRHLIPLDRLFAQWRWLSLVNNLWSLTGAWWLILGCGGILLGLVRSERRNEAVRLATTVVLIAAGLSVTWHDPRYGLILVPITILSAFLGIAIIAELWPRGQAIVLASAVVVALGVSGQTAVAKKFPIVSGFESVAEYLRLEGPRDTVLYAGYYDGVFGFHLRASDPMLEGRLVIFRKLIDSRQRAPGITAPDIVNLIRSECGCQWIAIERDKRRRNGPPMSELRAALAGPEFALVRSFAVQSPVTDRVDVYRTLIPVQPITSVDLTFPGFSQRVYRGVTPIKSRR
ncbi:MAG: hypothetical protein ACRD2N_04130 [Vicinamibacterales bacterium]